MNGFWGIDRQIGSFTGEYVGECHVGPPHVRDDVFDDQEIRHDCCLNSFEGRNKGRG